MVGRGRIQRVESRILERERVGSRIIQRVGRRRIHS